MPVWSPAMILQAAFREISLTSPQSIPHSAAQLHCSRIKLCQRLTANLELWCVVSVVCLCRTQHHPLLYCHHTNQGRMSSGGEQCPMICQSRKQETM